MFLPIRSKNPPESFPFATLGLILINVLVYAVTSDGWQVTEEAVNRWALKGSSPDLLHSFTSMFLHGDLFHLLGNMWFLYLFGFAVEGRLKPLKFLIMYLLAGLFGDLLHFLVVAQFEPDIPSLGASGAIMGVMGAAIWMFPHSKITCFYTFFFRFATFDIPMWVLGALYVGFDLVQGFLFGGHGVANFAHVGGVAGGLLITAAMRPQRDTEVASEAKAELAEIGDYSLLSQLQLAELHRMNPRNTTLVLNWAHKSVQHPSGITPECQKAFLACLPQMLQENPIQSVGYVLNVLASNPGVVRPQQLLNVAQRLEQAQDRQTAMALYANLLRDPSASLMDAESALYRYSLCCELNGWWDKAAHGYDQIVVKSPFGPFAEQAKARLDHIRRNRLGVQV